MFLAAHTTMGTTTVNAFTASGGSYSRGGSLGSIKIVMATEMIHLRISSRILSLYTPPPPPPLRSLAAAISFGLHATYPDINA